jgi:hypothetical protein
VTDTPETAEWEPDEPDTPAEADTTPTDEQPATPPEPPTGMKYDASGKLVEAEPHNRGPSTGLSYALRKRNATNSANG